MRKDLLPSFWRKCIAAGLAACSYAAAHAEPPQAAGKFASPAASKSPRQAYQSAEDKLWETAVESGKAGAYEAYLRKYPDGRYAARAQAELAEINAAEQESKRAARASQTTGNAASAATGAQRTARPELSAEDELWKGAQDSDMASDYEAYLRQYPQGRYAVAARTRLASLRPAQPPEAAQDSEWADQVYSGAGNVIRLKDQTMTGDFSVDPGSGKVSGRGRIVWGNGDRFEGTMVQGVKVGKGRFTWNNGHSYSGDWAGDMPNGKGSIRFANGDRYEGDVRNGKPHGQGVMRFNSGDSYRGAWVNGMRSGRGRYAWADGSYWEGEFKDGERTANGRLVRAEAIPARAGQPASNAR